MSHVNQDDGITYADGDEEYHYTGYIIISVPVDFTTNREYHDLDFDEEIRDHLEFDEYDIMGDELDVEIVKREWRD